MAYRGHKIRSWRYTCEAATTDHAPYRYGSLLTDITCYPPQPTPVPQVVGARWRQIESVRLIFRSDRMAEILRAPPILWRANLDGFCYVDEVRFVHYPYPISFSTDQSESGKAQACCRDDSHPGTLCGISASFGGLTYERTIMLGRERDGKGVYF